MKKIMLLGSLLVAFTSLSVTAGDYNKRKRVNNVYDVATSDRINRAVSRLRVRSDGVCVTTRSRNLPSGAYTSWWTIYNNPDACTQPLPYGNGKCGSFESRDPATEGTVMFANSFIVGPDGKTRNNACIGVGELTHIVLRGSGLGDPFSAEIHHTLRYHGPAAYGDTPALGAQLNEFFGGCQTDTQAGFPCFDPHNAVHGVPGRSNDDDDDDDDDDD